MHLSPLAFLGELRYMRKRFLKTVTALVLMWVAATVLVLVLGACGESPTEPESRRGMGASEAGDQRLEPPEASVFPSGGSDGPPDATTKTAGGETE